MKHIFKSTQVTLGQKAFQSHRTVAALVLAGILSLGAGLTLLNAAVAAPDPLQSPPETMNGEGERLPPQLANAVRRDLSQKTGIPLGNLRVISASPETWPDSCLGLPGPDEICAQVLVEGWRIVVSDGRQLWVYRTDTEGRILRLDTQASSVTRLPESVGNAVLQDLSQRSGLPISELRIVLAEQRTWPDACLGLYAPNVRCFGTPTPGWLVTVESGQQRWVYRTNESGSLVKLDEAASQASDAGTLPSTQIPASELPPPLPEGAIFRAIASGGFAGQTTETTLLDDGRVIQVVTNGVTSRSEICRIPRQQVRQFQQLVEGQQFTRLNGLSYPAPSGAADFFNITFTSLAGTVGYADVGQSEGLPKALQKVIQAWNQITSCTQG